MSICFLLFYKWRQLYALRSAVHLLNRIQRLHNQLQGQGVVSPILNRLDAAISLALIVRHIVWSIANPTGVCVLPHPKLEVGDYSIR